VAKLRAFVVEDSPVILEALTETLLEVANVEVVGTARDERDALAWMDSRTDGCDVVIVDIFLKSGSGLGVLRGMRDYNAPPTRVVLTNYATPEMRGRCQALGADVVFDKSYEMDGLMAWLSHRSPPLH
jgi:DNA-binding NarL/FixJ family response regulator